MEEKKDKLEVKDLRSKVIWKKRCVLRMMQYTNSVTGNKDAKSKF